MIGRVASVKVGASYEHQYSVIPIDYEVRITGKGWTLEIDHTTDSPKVGELVVVSQAPDHGPISVQPVRD